MMQSYTEEQKLELIEVARKRLGQYQKMHEAKNSSARPRGGIEFDYGVSIALMQIALAALTAPPVDWQQRAEAAEARANNLNDGWLNAISERDEARAKLAELAKQKPVGEAVDVGGSIMVEWERCISEGTELFTRPAPAINLAELVEASANKDPDEIIHLFDWIYDDRSRAWALANNVWDACHAAILRNIEEAK